MSWEVLEVVGLPVREERVVHKMSNGDEIKDMMATGETIRKEPGSSITKAEMDKAGQTEDDIAHLVKIKAIKEAGT